MEYIKLLQVIHLAQDVQTQEGMFLQFVLEYLAFFIK